MSSFTVKAGVSLPPVLQLAVVVAEVYAEFGMQCVITSGTDGKHGPKSLHYVGRALDFRTRHLAAGVANQIASRCRERLGDGFDIVVEGDHIHGEFDPT
jgi:hypothetical protein